MIYPSADDIKSICPAARRDIIVPLAAALPAVCDKESIDTPERLAGMLGQFAIEADHFKTYEEYATGAAYEGRNDLGNNRPGDGRRFKGRGPIQITGRANYREATPYVRDLLGRPTLDLESTPEIVASDKAVGLACAIWFWTENGLNKLADAKDFSGISRAVNRGNADSAKPALAEAERIDYSRRFLSMLEKLQERNAEAAPHAALSLAPDQVRSIQQALSDKGYGGIVGKVDGHAGPRTTAAITAFQEANGLPVTGKVSPEFLAAIVTASPLPVSPERADATAATLRANGSRIAIGAFRQKAASAMAGVGATVFGIAQDVPSAKGYIEQVKDYASGLPGWFWLLAIVGVAGALFVNGHGIESARVSDERSGRTA